MPRKTVRSRSRTIGRPPSALDSPRATRSFRLRRAEAASSMPAVLPAVRARASSSVLDQAARLSDAALGLGGARLRPAPEPFDLAPDRVGERLLVGGLAAKELVAPGEELAVAPVGLEESLRIDAVELEHASGHVLEEVAVVAHHEDGARPVGEDFLQPEDAIDVEMVGRLVHQQDVRLARQLARDREALPPAAGQRADRRAAVGEPGAAEGLGDPSRSLVLVHGAQDARDHLLDGAVQREDRILGHVAHADPAAEDAAAAVWLLDSRQDPEEGGLAGAIGSDEAHLIAVHEPERQAVEQRPGAVRLGDRLTAQEQRAGHLGYGSVPPSSTPVRMAVTANGPVSGRGSRRLPARACP